MRTRGARCAVAALLLAGLLAATSQATTAEPTVPIARGFVSDYAGVLDSATVRDLDNLIRELKSKTGAEIAVVVVKTTEPLTAFDYAMKIADAWKPGAKDKDNGVVFLAAIEDRELQILTGYGVEGVLPDGRVGAIRDRVVVPAFRQGDYSGGIRAATQEMAEIIAAGAGVTLSGGKHRLVTEQAPPKYQTVALLLLVFAVLLVIWLSTDLGSLPLGRRRYGRGGGYGGLGGYGGGFGGGFGSGGGGGFGGFGGGGFGGGGAGGKW